jgi:hypothetical protein
MTVQELVNRALTINGRLGIGRTAGPAESAICLGILNAMLESWALDRLMVNTLLQARYALLANKQTYYIGPSAAEFPTQRPAMVEHANLIVTISAAEASIPLDIITAAEWATIRMKNDTSPVPTKLYDDYAGPNSALSFYPVPSANCTVELWTWSVGGGFKALGDAAGFAPGYERAVAAQLAIETAPHVGRPVTQDMTNQAMDAIITVKKLNASRFKLPMVEAPGGKQ